jgi:dolichol-phosphate mannosyltransferase
MYKILVIIPAFNESKNIESVIKKVNSIRGNLIDKICVIDDNSSDNTAELASNLGTFVIKHEKNLGVGAAIRTGLDYGYNENYDIAIIISGDNQHNPNEIYRVIDPIINSGFDFIQGSRFIKGGKTINQPFLRLFLTKIYSLIFFISTGKKCTDITNGFRAFKIKPILEDPSINLYQDWLNKYELEVYIIYKVYTSKRFVKKEVPISILYHSIKKDRTKMKPFSDWWRIFRPIVYLKFNIKK